MSVGALVVQCYVKLDTLKALCDAIIQCDGAKDFDLIFWCDSSSGGRNEAGLGPKRAEVKSFVNEFASGLGQMYFSSVQVHENLQNRGTCKTCELAMNYAFESHDFAIFTEDDGIFERDALTWFKRMRSEVLPTEQKLWAVAGESIYFNARENAAEAELIEAARTAAVNFELVSKYVNLNFVPSTCFATTKDKWLEFASTRGQPLGDEDVCKRCISEGKYCIFPVVPRVKDVGMLHDLGYSVLIHTKSGVRELKNTYLTSGMLLQGRPDSELTFAPLADSLSGPLYSQSSVRLQFD